VIESASPRKVSRGVTESARKDSAGSPEPFASLTWGHNLLFNVRHDQLTMTPEAFRSTALGLPGVVESAHMRHPDFRCKGKIFATLGYPDESWGMVKLSPDQQRYFLSKAPDVFDLASGAWGRSGSTVVRLALAKKAVVKAAILAAFKNVAASKKHA